MICEPETWPTNLDNYSWSAGSLQYHYPIRGTKAHPALLEWITVENVDPKTPFYYSK